MDIAKPLHYTNEYYFNPGGVAKVGDVRTSVKYRRSNAEMTPLFDVRASRGSNVVDGNFMGMFNVSCPARTLDDAMYPHERKVSVGRKWKDVRPTDRLKVPKIGEDSKYMVRSKNVPSKMDSGFSRLPGGYGPTPNSLPRGVLTPRTTDITAAAAQDLTPTQVNLGLGLPKPITNLLGI
jgi:hypothetical protein